MEPKSLHPECQNLREMEKAVTQREICVVKKGNELIQTVSSMSTTVLSWRHSVCFELPSYFP